MCVHARVCTFELQAEVQKRVEHVALVAAYGALHLAAKPPPEDLVDDVPLIGLILGPPANK